MKQHYGIDSMPETAENVAEDFYQIGREDQDAFACARRPAPARRRSQRPTGEGDRRGGHSAAPQGDAIVVDRDEHPRDTTLEQLGSRLRARSATAAR
jgi:acetyl-CoA acyltransferase